MDKEIKREARKQYFHYFRIWFLILGILVLLVSGAGVLKAIRSMQSRSNPEAPTERVYDYADVLTEEEEQALRDYIAICEQRAHIDIVLVTISEAVEGDLTESDLPEAFHAREISAYSSWEYTMMSLADNFYDYNEFGFNKARGDGVLLLDNWYEGQKGSWLSTCGSVYQRFGDAEIDDTLDEVYYSVDEDPYEAYRAYVTYVTKIMSRSSIPVPFNALVILVLPAIVAIVYAVYHLKQSKAQDTTSSKTYVENSSTKLNQKQDDFIRKSVVSHKIESSSSGSSSGHHSGGGGGHRSSSGTSHGGGGRRR